jgi:hypothetical protein
MKTLELKGNLLSFYVALALKLDSNPDFWVPWDYWEGDISVNRHQFGPFDTPDAHTQNNAFGQLYPTAKTLKLSATPEGEMYRMQLPSGAAFLAQDLLYGYALAIVHACFGETVPDHYDCPHFKKRIDLTLFNLIYGEESVVNQ